MGQRVSNFFGHSKRAFDLDRNLRKRRARSDMARGDFDLMGQRAISERLVLLRMAFAGDRQAEFARRMTIERRTWNNYERGYRIGLTQALLVCGKTGATLDWIYRGLEGGMPQRLLQQIAEIQAKDKKARA